jgi:hypothetical protein
MVTRTLALGVLLAAFLSTTIAGASIRGTANASATSRGLVVGGARFFPVMLIDQCTASDMAKSRTLGINLVVNESCPGVSPGAQLSRLRGNGLAVLPIGARTTRGARLVGWTYPDEPDNNGWTPASLAKTHPYRRGNNDGLVTFVTTTGRFFRSTQVPLARYSGFARLADMAGFDLYPLNACQADLASIYNAQQMFVKLAGSTPTFQWIETGPIRPSYCGGFTMTPDQLNAEVWLAVIGGARGIGYFTHTWTPDHHSFDVAPALQDAMGQTNRLLAAVKPGLLGTTVASAADSPAVKVVARVGGGRTYVFSINTLATPNKAQISVPQLRDGPAQVLGEARTVAVLNHSLVDNYAGLRVHVYVQAR